MMKKPKGVYCLEIGEWFGPMRHNHSVEPALELLARSPGKVPYLHRDIATESEFRFYLSKWTQSQQKGYPLLYLAFHGSPGAIELRKENGRGLSFPIEELFSAVEGGCDRKIIHFGACSTIKIHSRIASRYLRQSGALAITGFSEAVDWTEAACFEMLFFNALQRCHMTPKGMIKLREELKDLAGGLMKHLGFTMRIA
ncbi:MAG: hypothetical protein JNK37_14785 [Verrucomicrobiales bacterium]|nr:hypothetical protein [Verrucomicrobiales bacterium]